VKDYSPKPLRPISKKNRYINELRREQRRHRPAFGRGVRFKQRSSGTIIESRPGDSSGRQPVDTWFVGDWSPNVSYTEGNGVCIRGGLTAGLYMCHTDAPAGTPPPSPADDSYWTLLVSGNAMGNWI
jgi:hypothetical protein